jgi:hypothetical protein
MFHKTIFGTCMTKSSTKCVHEITSVCLSVRSTSNVAWIFMQYYLWYCLLRHVDLIHFWLKWTRNYSHLTAKAHKYCDIHPKHNWEIFRIYLKGNEPYINALHFLISSAVFKIFVHAGYLMVHSVFWGVTWHRLVAGYWSFSVIVQSHPHL